MQLPVFLGLLCVGFVLTITSEDLYNEDQRLKGFVDGLVNKTINDLVANLPEPITIDSSALNLSSSSLIEGEANISNFKLSGLKNLVATKIDVVILALTMNATIVIPEFALSTKYFADVLVADFIPLYGSGRAAVTLEDIEISLGGKVAISPISITNVSVQILLGDAEFDLHGLLNNEDFSSLVNQVLNDNLVTFINTYKETIGNIISPIAQLIINSLLGSSEEISELFTDIDLNRLE